MVAAQLASSRNQSVRAAIMPSVTRVAAGHAPELVALLVAQSIESVGSVNIDVDIRVNYD